MSAADVYAALSEVGFVAVGETAYKFVRACSLARFGNLFVGGVLVAPQQVFADCPAEQHVLLQYHRHSFAQVVQAVIFYVVTADNYRSAQHVVKTRNKLHKAAFAVACAADYAYRFARLDVKVDVLESQVVLVVAVTEVYVVKHDAAVRDGQVACRAFDVGFRFKHFVNTVE